MWQHRREALSKRFESIDWMPVGGVFALVNQRGELGSGALAVAAHTGNVVLLTSYHFLFADGRSLGPVAIRQDRKKIEIANPWYGRIGVVGRQFFDCGVATITNGRGDLHAAQFTSAEEPEVAKAVVKSAVTKTGAGSGTTEGVIVSTTAAEEAMIDGRPVRATQQILVRVTTERGGFSTSGDSGALLSDEHDRIVGMLWGRNARDEGIACHIGPVLALLGIRLARLAQLGVAQ